MDGLRLLCRGGCALGHGADLARARKLELPPAEQRGKGERDQPGLAERLLEQQRAEGAKQG